MGYRQDVINPGDEISRIAAAVNQASYYNCDAVEVHEPPRDHFRGLVGWSWRRHILQSMLDGRVLETVQSDGAGGKPQFFTLLGDVEAFQGLGWEIITMNADDIACGGGFPALMVSNIDVKRVTRGNIHLARAVIAGCQDALRAAGLVMITGETAIMKHSITAFCDLARNELVLGDDSADFNQLILTWGGACIGLMQRRARFDGHSITPDMTIIGLRERGYRCNGGTALTNLILNTWGPDVRGIMQSPEAEWFIRQATIPSRSYANLLCRLNGWGGHGTWERRQGIHGMAHITGGGVWGKFGELLPSGVGADLDQMPPPPPILTEAQRLSRQTDSPISDYHGYDTFHGGCGAFIVCARDAVAGVLRMAGSHGHDAVVVGKTTASRDDEIRIQSRFLGGEELSSLRPPP